MNDTKSAKVVAALAGSLPLHDLPFDNRSDEWWDAFWREFGMAQAKWICRELEDKRRRRYED